MKHLILFFVLLGLLASCQNNATEQKPAEADQKNQAAQNMTPEQMEELKKTAGLDVKIANNSPIVGGGKGVINGKAVKIQKDASLQSEKVGVLEDKENVDILETQVVQSEGEAIINKPITVKGAGGSMNLPKGTSVTVENYQTDGKPNTVKYEDPKKGILTAQVEASTIETFIYANWYNVKRNNGETGWVYGKFVKVN